MRALPMSLSSFAAQRRFVPALAGVALAMGLSACASTQLDTGLPSAGRVTIGLPAGDWVDLGAGQELVPANGQGPAAIGMGTRAVGLRGSQGEVQAVVLVLANAEGNPAQVTQWGQACEAGPGMRVVDQAKRSPERVDCLRIKRRAVAGDWLASHEPQVSQWLAARNVPLPYNAMLVSHQFGNKAGAYVAAYVLADSRLLEPVTRNNTEFLNAGVPAVTWSRELAQAVRVSTSMMDGRLDVPAFPLPQPEGPGQVAPQDDVPAAMPLKARKTELPPLPTREAERPPLKARPDRE